MFRATEGDYIKQDFLNIQPAPEASGTIFITSATRDLKSCVTQELPRMDIITESLS